MKVAIYVRVSTVDQTVEQQVDPLVNKCISNSWSYSIFQDVGISGAKETRPELDKMMTAIRSKEFDTVLVWRLDRLGRSLKHLLQLVEEFNNKKIKFICMNPDIDTTTSQGRFFLQIMGAVGELEREMIRDRIKDKLNNKKEQIIKNGFFKTLDGRKVTSLGRPKGLKDSRPRKKAGYFNRFKKTTLINPTEFTKEI